MHTKLWDVYVAMRARIALRKDGVPLSDEAVKTQIKDIKNNVGLPVSIQDIISALQSGEEVFIPLCGTSIIIYSIDIRLSGD